MPCSCSYKCTYIHTYTRRVDGLGDAGLPDAEARHVAHDEHAALAMIRLSKEYPGEITLVCLGPLTNLALACKLDEGLPGKFKDFLWMGGTTRAKGNVSLTSEFNVHKDPEAAHIVLSAFPNSTMVSECMCASKVCPLVSHTLFLCLFFPPQQNKTKTHRSHGK